MIELSAVEAKLMMQAFDQLQTMDLLSSKQLDLALKIMDQFPDLSDEYRYLRNRYDDKTFRN